MESLRAAQSDRRNQSPRTATVLVVEDEELVCEVTCEVLGQSGYRVLRASDAVGARELFAQTGREIDLLFCDTVLPDQNGAALAAALSQESPKLKVILCSGYPASVLAKQAAGVDGVSFLTKPYSAQALLSKVGSVLKSRRPARASGPQTLCSAQPAESGWESPQAGQSTAEFHAPHNIAASHTPRT